MGAGGGGVGFSSYGAHGYVIGAGVSNRAAARMVEEETAREFT